MPNNFQNNYILFLKELRDKLGRNILITAAVPDSQYYINTSYDVPKMNR